MWYVMLTHEEMHRFKVDDLHLPPLAEPAQEGFFHHSKTSIVVLSITGPYDEGGPLTADST